MGSGAGGGSVRKRGRKVDCCDRRKGGRKVDTHTCGTCVVHTSGVRHHTAGVRHHTSGVRQCTRDQHGIAGSGPAALQLDVDEFGQGLAKMDVSVLFCHVYCICAHLHTGFRV